MRFLLLLFCSTSVSITIACDNEIFSDQLISSVWKLLLKGMTHRSYIICTVIYMSTYTTNKGCVNVKYNSALSNCRVVMEVIAGIIYFDLNLFVVFSATFSNISAIIMVTSFSGGRSRSTRRKPPTMDKQLVNFYHLRLRVECTFL
jgi:hypothetical protein